MVIEVIMRQKSLVIVVMGTGAGKSILFILPALYSIKVIIVVILLISLRGDIKTQYKKVGIKCVK